MARSSCTLRCRSARTRGCCWSSSAILPALRPLFEGLDEDAALDVENALEWVDLPAGETLFEQGDDAPDAYVVTAGHLAILMGAGACHRTVARICPGEVVGEMALLADAPRSATVVALHDSYLIRLPRRAFDVLMEGAPDARRYLFRVLTSRLQHTSSGAAPAVAAEKIAIIPLGPVEPVRETLDWLAHKVSPIIIGSACQEDRWDHGGAIAGQKVVYMANNHHSAWARRCIDQADRVIFVVDVNSGAVGVDVVAAAARLDREMNLVLVNPRKADLPTGAAAWLSHFPPSQILHVPRRRYQGLRACFAPNLAVERVYGAFGRRRSGSRPYRRHSGAGGSGRANRRDCRHEYGRADCSAGRERRPGC